MNLNILSNCNERYIVIVDSKTKSGFRILDDRKDTRLSKARYYNFIASPDSYCGYILIGSNGEVFTEIVAVFETMQEASIWVHNNKEIY